MIKEIINPALAVTKGNANIPAPIAVPAYIRIEPIYFNKNDHPTII